MLESLWLILPAFSQGLRRMTGTLKKLVALMLGVLFVVLGVIGLFLPVLQGILFLAIGLSLLSYDSPWAERLRRRLYERFPAAAGRLERVTRRAKLIVANARRRFGGRRTVT